MKDGGRLDIRFGDLLPQIEDAARACDRKPGAWVRLQIKKALQRRRRSRQAKSATS